MFSVVFESCGTDRQTDRRTDKTCNAAYSDGRIKTQQFASAAVVGPEWLRHLLFTFYARKQLLLSARINPVSYTHLTLPTKRIV